MKIGKTIIEEGIKDLNIDKERITARAVILNGNKEIMMLYSTHYNDYTFPGGGVHEDEDMVEALRRELSEEIGAKEILVKDKLGYMEEIRYGGRGSNSLYKQTSHYYICDVNGFGKPSYVGSELIHGLEARWIRIEDAINHNLEVQLDERHSKKGLKTVIIREIQVLRHILEFVNA